MKPRHLIGCVVLLSSTIGGCSTNDTSQSETAARVPVLPAIGDREDSPFAQVSWDVSEVESYFKIASPPAFDASNDAFVMIIEAKEDGHCAVAPAVPSGFFGFEAVLFDQDDNEIHIAHDIGSATQTPASAEAYHDKSSKRICVDPPRWTTGTKIRLMIAPGVDRAILANARRGKVSAI